MTFETFLDCCIWQFTERRFFYIFVGIVLPLINILKHFEIFVSGILL